MKKEYPSYFDLKYSKTSKIFEAEEIKDLSPEEILEGEKLYYDLLDKLEKGENIDEGIFGGLIGGLSGAIVGPAIGRALCSVLGIDQKGILGKLLTSRLVTTSMGIAIGK